MTIKHPAPHQAPDLRRLWQQAFGDTQAFLDAFFATAFSQDRCLIAESGSRPVAALYWLDCNFQGEKLAYLYAVATDPDHRGKGLCHRLMDATHAHLAAHGYAGAVLVPGDEGLFRLYAGMGYRPFGGIREFTAVAKAPATPLRPVSPTEYAALRKAYLPPGGVAQEGETLAFLQTQFTFYAGEGFILAAAREGDHAFVPELLGEASPESITKALGATTATLRVPGDTPFAMYLPFKNAPPPAYFGFAMD